MDQYLNNWINPISNIENQSIINNLLKQNAPGPGKLTGKFYQTFKKEIIPIL